MNPSCPICDKQMCKNGTKEGIQYYWCRDEDEHKHHWNELELKDVELIAENVNLKKQTQKFQDTNRIERKAFREYARIENAVTEYSKELVVLNKQFAKQLTKFKVSKIKGQSKVVGIAHISDWHANELIDLPHNKYDFQVLADRAYKHAEEAIRLFKAYDIKDILIAHTGDLMNSDRRLDELLNQATNRVH